MIPRISLEQWASFVAVVEEGSFASAAEVLNKSQSTVSYSVGKMEERLPAPVFKQSGRKAELTDFGRGIFRHAKTLLAQALQVDQMANYLASGWEPEVVLCVDGIADMTPVFCALQNFSEQSPNTRIRILETTLSGTEETLLRREADLVITAKVPPGFLAEPFGHVTKIPVVSPEHPLAKVDKALDEHTLKQYRQIVIRDSGTRRVQDSGWLGAEQRWTVTHFGTSIEIIKAGLGFGFLPREKIIQELEDGSLVTFELTFGSQQDINLHLVASAQSDAGQATKALIRHLLAAIKSSSKSRDGGS